MSRNTSWKKRVGVVYSTDPRFSFETHEETDPETLSPEKQTLRILLSTKHRKGKKVTLITGFIGKPDDLKSLEKDLKSRFATGGSSKNNEIVLQGDFREEAGKYLRSKGYIIKGIHTL